MSEPVRRAKPLHANRRTLWICRAPEHLASVWRLFAFRSQPDPDVQRRRRERQVLAAERLRKDTAAKIPATFLDFGAAAGGRRRDCPAHHDGSQIEAPRGLDPTETSYPSISIEREP